MEREEIVSELRERIENGGKMWENARGLGKKYGVAPGTIVRWYYATYPKSECHGNATLSPEEEEQLALACLAMSHVNLDLSIAQIIDAAKSFFNVDLSSSSAYCFKDHHSSLFSFQKGTSLGEKQTGNHLYDESVHFIGCYKKFLEKKRLPLVQLSTMMSPDSS